MNFLTNKYARALTVALIIQLSAFYAVAMRPERVPVVNALSAFPNTFGRWTTWRDFPLDADTQAVLKADDVLNRFYIDPSAMHTCASADDAASSDTCINLFIAYFRSQRYGQAPHSPKNCLPGAGWEQVSAERPAIDVPGENHLISINNFVTEHGDQKSVSLYWYQSHQRIIASEYAAKFWSVVDSIRYHRSDTAIVRVTIPVVNGNIDAAVQTGYSFVRAIFPSLLHQLPQ
jgi:EpsI family protein